MEYEVLINCISDLVGLYHLSTNGLSRCRDEMLEDSRLSLTKSLLMCPPNLRWKILLVGARYFIGMFTRYYCRT